MKKTLLILLISLSVVGCSYVQLTDLPSSESEAEKIISLGLTHSESLSAAQNLKDPKLVLAVIEKLEKSEELKNKLRIEAEDVIKYAEMVKVSSVNSDGEIAFTGAEVFTTEKNSFFSDEYESQKYFLHSVKSNNGEMEHKLRLSIIYSSNNWRSYDSSNFCDKWRCDEDDQIKINLISSDASKCNDSGCEYREIMELSLSDAFLKSNIDKGFSLKVNSKKVATKVNLASSYVLGYLNIVN